MRNVPIAHRFETLVYQTDCWYTDRGQLVVAQVRRRDKNRVVYFVDISRMVSGYVELPQFTFTAQAIHQEYLHNRYVNDCPMAIRVELEEIGKDAFEQHHNKLAPRS